MKLSKAQLKQVRGDWEIKNFRTGELKLIPRHVWDKSFPKFRKTLQYINKEEIKKNPRKYSQVI